MKIKLVRLKMVVSIAPGVNDGTIQNEPTTKQAQVHPVDMDWDGESLLITPRDGKTPPSIIPNSNILRMVPVDVDESTAIMAPDPVVVPEMQETKEPLTGLAGWAEGAVEAAKRPLNPTPIPDPIKDAEENGEAVGGEPDKLFVTQPTPKKTTKKKAHKKKR